MQPANQMGKENQQDVTVIPTGRGLLKKLRGGALLTIGFLLSPLCWWNDLVFNLPVAYGFGYLCSLVSPDWLIPGMIGGYWLSNIVGILLMQAGVLDLAHQQGSERNLRKELLTGILSSTVYTGIILGLVQFKVLDTPLLLLSQQFPQISALFAR